MTAEELAAHELEGSVEFPCPHHADSTVVATLQDGMWEFVCLEGCTSDEIAKAIASTNGHLHAKSNNQQLYDWKLALSGYVKVKSNQEEGYHEKGVDRATYRQWVYEDCASIPSRMPDKTFLHPPAYLTASEREEETWSVVDAYLPARKEDKDYELDRVLPEIPVKGFQTVAEYLAEYAERSNRPYMLEEMFYAGSFSLLLGRPFSGKSSISAALIRAFTLADTFLGRRCRQSKCAYLALERNGAAVAQLFEKWGLENEVYFRDNIPVENVEEFIESEIRRLKIESLVIDHLQHAVHIQDDKSYSEVSEKLGPYQRIAKETNCFILGLHHQPKTKPDKDQPVDEAEINAMGSEAYRAAADTLMEATTYGREYFLRAHPRTGTDLERTRIVIDFETGAVEGTDAQQAEIDIAVGEIKVYVKEHGESTEAEIRKGVTGANQIISRALRQGVEQGHLERLGVGGKGHVFKYVLGLVYR